MTLKTARVAGRVTTAFLIVGGFLITLGCENPASFISGLWLRHTPAISSAIAIVDPEDADGDSEPAAFPPAEDLINDWQEPDVTFFVSGRLHGYIEPCGCTGLDNQKGGLMRRRACQNVLLDRGWDLVMVDAGNQIRRPGQQPALKLKTTYDILSEVMNYDFIGFGADDLKVTGTDMVSVIANVQREPNQFCSANMMVFEDDSFTSPFRIIERNGKTIGITSVIGAEHLAQFNDDEEYSVADPAKSIAKVVADARFAACDIKMLIAQSDIESCRKLAQQFPVFDLLITAGGSGDPTLMPEQIPIRGGQTAMVQVGVKGMYVGIVGVDFEGEGKVVRYQRVPLDARFKDTNDIKRRFSTYQDELRNLWQAGLLDDIKPRLHPSGNKFVGSMVCNDCHDVEYDIWENGVDGDGGPHERATLDLIEPGERTWVKRIYDPECVSCHATGWNPQEYFPYETGFINLDDDSHLNGNGCENCHGPGSAHVAAENDGGDEAMLEGLRQQMVVTKTQAKEKLCYSCHDLDNSPDYAEAQDGFEKFWPAIAHGEDDE